MLLCAQEYLILHFNTYLDVNVNRDIAKGRLVLGGGSYADSTMQLRLRIVYSDL